MAFLTSHMALLIAATFASSARAIPTAEHLRKRSGGVENGYSGISQSQVNWMIAGGAVGAFIVVCLIVWGIWKWRKVFLRAWRRPRDNNDALDQYYSDYKQDGSFMSEKKSYNLFGSRMGHSRDPSAETLEAPPPALAPSDTTLRRHVSERRQLVRESMLDDEHKQRVLAPENSTFFLEEDELPVERHADAKRRKGSADHLRVVIPQATETHRGTFYFPPPPIPDSPEAAHTQSRFSWTSTNPDGKSIRSSMESEPARYRTVNSWVSHQANRTERKSDQLSVDTSQLVDPPPVSSPSTPAAFRHHPGAPVSFIAMHTRLESKDLDRQL